MDNKNYAIILAAGKGSRMGEELNKVYLPLGGKPVLAHALEAFYSLPSVHGIVLVIAEGEEELLRDMILDIYSPKKPLKLIIGGSTRQDSVYNGLMALPENTDMVAIHDGARPLVVPETIQKGFEVAKLYGGSVAGMPTKDTIKALDPDNRIKETMDRKGLWIAQTPQTFRYSLIMEGHNRARETGFVATDDSALVEEIGGHVRMIEGGYYNIKITTQEDLAIAHRYLTARGKVT